MNCGLSAWGVAIMGGVYAAIAMLLWRAREWHTRKTELRVWQEVHRLVHMNTAEMHQELNRLRGDLDDVRN